MQAIRIHEHGDSSVLRIDSVEKPSPGTKQVVVQMRAAALNHLDLWVRNGLPGAALPLPMTLGSDGSGVVSQTGAGVEGIAVGDEVVIQPGIFCGVCQTCQAGHHNLCPDFGILGESTDGVQTNYALVNDYNIFKKPAHLSFEEAASFGLVYLTAYQMLVKRAQLKAGENVLVLGGSSGVGAAAIQIAKNIGAYVIATASKGPKTDFAMTMGADVVVDHYGDAWHTDVLAAAGPKKVQVVLEHIGEATWNSSMRTLSIGGRMVTCGATTGPKVGIDLRHTYRKHLSFLGSTMGDLDTFQKVVDGFNHKAYRPFVDRVFPMAEIAAAHDYLEQSKHSGKVIVRIN